MMANELLAILYRTNLALSFAVLVALALRAPLRRGFGPQRAYAIWLIAPLALVGAFMPTPRGSGPRHLIEAAANSAQAFFLKAPSTQDVLVAVWLAGVGLNLMLAAHRHGRFMAEIRQGRAGPAIVGLIRPRLVTPSDFRTTFSPRVQVLIRAHERVHMERDDARWNALAALLQALLWFNPLIHIGVRAMKLDQELACDARVIDQFPEDRRTYAQALLSAQTLGAASPLGCHWMSSRVHPLVTRIGAIANRSGSIERDGLWIALSLSLWVGGFAVAWAAQPPDRTLDKHAIQYVRYAGGAPGSPKAIWRIAVNPD